MQSDRITLRAPGDMPSVTMHCTRAHGATHTHTRGDLHRRHAAENDDITTDLRVTGV